MRSTPLGGCGGAQRRGTSPEGVSRVSSGASLAEECDGASSWHGCDDVLLGGGEAPVAPLSAWQSTTCGSRSYPFP